MSANNTTALGNDTSGETYWSSRNIFVDVLAVLIFFINLVLIYVLLQSPRCRKQVRDSQSDLSD